MDLEGISGGDLEKLRNKYSEERDKRRHPDGLNQYIIDLAASESFGKYQKDPWNSSKLQPRPHGTTRRGDKPAIEDGDSCTFLIIGAGYGGILFAANLVKSGVDPKCIRMVDLAQGFGGTWYWNRYPGLQCDVESYIYMPLLEDTGYIPKQKYSFGPELREQATRIVQKFHLEDKALFEARADTLIWDDETNEWNAKLHLESDDRYISVRSKFVMTAYGIGHYPKLPNLPGLDSFHGAAFHTSRWDYSVTGGTEELPELTNLRDKRVGIVGTGATAVQAVPYLAKWAKELYVFQRTPSTIGPRNNRPTDNEKWASEIATHEGWQMDRAENFSAWLSNDEPKPSADLIDDEWTKLPSYSALLGSRNSAAKGLDSREKVAGYVALLEELDLSRQQLARQRVDDIVTDKATAEGLKPWYPSWCKRPCFNDEYLQAFNRPNVTLVTTGAKGVESVDSSGVTVSGQKYDVDVLIFATGFRPPTSGSPAERSRMKVYGRHGRDMDEKWQSGVSTLHGMISRDFPNFFFPGPNQMGAAPNGTYMRDRLGQHWASLINDAAAQLARQHSESTWTGNRYGRFDFVVEPTVEAEHEWTELVASHARSLSALATCTPNYMITPGDQEAISASVHRAERLKKSQRAALWGKGIADYMEVLGMWREDGTLRGLELKRDYLSRTRTTWN